MFYYLSFLRPPPSQAQPSGTISITPQIANDLRTVHYDSEQDIFCSWQRVLGVPNGTPTQTKPVKLTTWRQAAAYKEIPVPIPTGFQEGQAWRLLLTCELGSKSSSGYTISLDDRHLGSSPFPVVSMPIEFSVRVPKAAAAKQVRIERVYTFSLPRPHDAKEPPPPSLGTQVPAVGPDERKANFPQAKISIKVTEQTSFDLDKKVWDSGIGLSSWLVNLAKAPDLDVPAADLDESLKPKTRLICSLRDVLFADQPRCVVELGTGTGIVALTIGALRGVLAPTHESRIVATDLESAMPLLERNIVQNETLFPEGTGARPLAVTLDWDDGVPEDLQHILSQRGIDAIIMADVTYNTSSFPSLVRTLSTLVNLGKKPPLILLGYKERDAAERSLWDLAEEANIHFNIVGNIPGAGDAPIEIWIGAVMN